jgi:hypothetical protein
MKTNLLCLLLFVLFYANTNAQILLMPRGGITYSNLSLSDDFRRGNGQNTRYNLGYTFGVSVNIPVAGPFSIQPEVNFTQKGFKILYEEFDSEEEYTETSRFFLNYVEVPILGSLQFGDQNVQVIINLGPSIAYATGGKLKYEEKYVDITTPANSETTQEEIKIKFGKEPENDTSTDIYIDNAFDIGLQAGLGLGINAGPGFIVLEQRFGMGLLNLRDRTVDAPNRNVKSVNRNFYISLGYTIPIGGGKAEEGGGRERSIKNVFKRR